MSKIIYTILCILQYIIFTNGQNIPIIPPQDACTQSTLTLRCPINYVVVVRSASYGVAQNFGSCSYTTGDCIADAMSIMLCIQDTTDCSIYVTKTKLPQCNDHFADYIHVEFDCIPISMNDPSKEYNICQNDSDITTDYGIIKSPGYPSQFQPITIECFRMIHIPDNKIIRLWLSDLYIGSTSTNCADDYVYIIDNVQTYKHCGLKRYAYPYLCSSTIIIQYLATTKVSSYRGMRIYFEIIDRPVNDNCPKLTVTPVPISTTTVTTIEPGTTTETPIYVQLGIASPTRTFQICSGESRIIECPNDYAVVILTNIFGVTSSNQCETHDANKHCIVTTDPLLSCRQTCSFQYTGNQIIPSCNSRVAAYQYIEYQCIPTNTELISPNTSCPTDGSKTLISFDRNGRFQNYNYPNISRMNCTYRLQTKPGYIMHIYALDISLNNLIPYCQTNLMTLIEDGENQGTNFCEQRTYSLIYSSCSNELDLHYLIDDVSQMFSYGIDLYIENQIHPFDWLCGQVLSTPTNPTPIRTTPSTPRATSITSTSFIGALNEVENDICFGEALNYACPYGYTFMIVSAYYGIKNQISNPCRFIPNDCVEEVTSTITQCHTDSPNCYLPYSIKRRLTHCLDQYADYLHIVSQCVPSFPIGSSSSLSQYNICDKNSSIRDLNGVITSPNFPSYMQTNNECKRDIFGVQDRLLKIWLNEMSISSNDQHNSNKPDLIIYKTTEFDNIEQIYPLIRDTCRKDYFILNTRYITYIYCGTRKLSLEAICTSSATIQYKTTTSPNIYNKGFKLYFEWIEKPADISCQGTPATFDPLASTTTPMDEPLPNWAQNLDISPILSKHICLSTMESIKCPRSNDYVIAIDNSQYGVTDTGSCDVPSFSDCFQKASLSLTCTQSCLIEYIIPKPLLHCNNQIADYLTIDYLCLPTRLINSDNPIDICASTTTDTIAIDKGLMISPQYPLLNSISSCSKTIETLPNKLWMIYIVDLYLKGENDYGDCLDASLTIDDGKDIRIICGLQQPQLVFTSCSNIVQFNFLSNHQLFGYRGFKIFFTTIDVPPGWSCAPSGFTSTIQQTTTQTLPPTTLIPPSLQIAAYGGTTVNGIRQYCRFPFTYQGNQYTKCISDKPPNTTVIQTDSWCSLTDNYDTDHQWGFCDIGVTDSTFLDICRTQSQKLQCSDGYVINIIIADYAAKLDGGTACISNRTDCFQSEISAIQLACAGKTSCTVYHISRTLASCQNRLSAYLHIGYTCVPDSIQDIHTYVMCSNDSKLQDDIRRGFLISPNFPNTQNNIDCTYDIQLLKPRLDLYLYIVDMNLNDPNSLGQNCIKDRLIVKAGSNAGEWCGLSYTNLILKTCHTPISLQLIRSSDAMGGGVKLYFEFREQSPNEICEEIVTPSTRPTLIPTSSGPTTVPSRPNYFPNPSPNLYKILCYPDPSGSFGTNNFQCPFDYLIVIRRAFYGNGNRCNYVPGDCIIEADSVYRICSGKQACSVSFENIVTISHCNHVPANYLFVEYQCLPTLAIAQNINDLCTNQTDQLTGISGILRSTSYPSYTQKECMNTTLSLPESSNFVIYMYLLDLDIGLPDVETGQCSNDYLLLSYQCNNQLYNQYLCGTRQTEVLFDTCSPTDKIFASYNLTNSNAQSQRGFALLYHLLPKPTISTITPPITPTTMSTSTTITSTTTTMSTSTVITTTAMSTSTAITTMSTSTATTTMSTSTISTSTAITTMSTSTISTSTAITTMSTSTPITATDMSTSTIITSVTMTTSTPVTMTTSTPVTTTVISTSTPVTTTTAMSTSAPITTMTMSTSPSSGPGPLSTLILQSIVCGQNIMQLQCNPDYVLVLHKIDLSVSKTGSCNYSPDDCFEEQTYLHGSCGGKPSCSFVAPLIPLSKCNNSMSNYFYAEYQCIPTQPKLNFNICARPNPTEKVDGGAIISSEGYTSASEACSINLESAKESKDQFHKAFSVYIVMLNLPIESYREQGSQCNDNNPYIEIEDSQIGITRFCGNSHTRKLFETCSNTIQIHYKNFNETTNNIQYKGFRLYIESIEKHDCSDISTITPPIPQQPFVIKEEIACTSLSNHERVSLSCTPDHGLVFLQSYEFLTNDPLSCNITQQTCFYSSEQPQASCSGQLSCTYIYTNPSDSQLNMCHSNRSDLIQFFYQCIPMKPTLTYLKATFCIDTHITLDQGFIETPNYPNTYEYGPRQCSLRISLPNTTEGQKLSIYLYIIDLSIRDTSTIDSPSPIQCYDSITYHDGKTNRSLCGNIDQPIFEYQTDKDELELTLNIAESLPSNISSDWHGARFFFLIGNQSFPSPPTNPTSGTTTKPDKPGKSNYGPLIGGIVGAFLVVIICVIGYLYYRRRRSSSKKPEEVQMEFQLDQDSFDDDDTNDGQNVKRSSSIPPAAFGNSTFNNSVFKPKLTVDDSEA